MNPLKAQIVELLSDPTKYFYPWLQSFDADEKVGTAGACYGCPIAMFLKDKLDLELKVFRYSVESDILGNIVRFLPNSSLHWVIKFTSNVDSITGDEEPHYVLAETILAKDAIAALDKATVICPQD